MHCASCFFYETDVGDEVCNRCGRAYMPEANVYLGLLLLVTGGVAATLRHLLTGQLDPFVKPSLDLGAWATWPVSIVDCPAYGFVMGAWLGMLAVAPILTGILYGKRGGWLLVIVLALVGPGLVMAAVIGAGVWVAASRRMQLGSKFASSLLGLIPVTIYWFVATNQSEVETLAPALRGLAYVPPLVAVVVAVAASALVIASGWADRWHVRWPGSLLAVLVAGPVLALPALVGMDEIRFGLQLEDRPTPALRAAPEAPETDRLQAFLKRYPTSPRAAEVRARLADRLEDLEATSRAPATAPRAQDLWQEILSRHADSPQAVDALVHLGDASARQGLFDTAEQSYQAALAKATVAGPPLEDPLAKFTAVWHLFSIGPGLRAKEMAEHLEALRTDVLARLAILADNRRNTQDNSRALALYFVALGLKGTNHYREALLAARDAEPKGALADNIAYDLAMFGAGTKRIQELVEVARAYPGTDGAMLADLEAAHDLIELAASDPGAMREAQQHLLAVQADLAARRAHRPADHYVAALADRVEKELVYVQAQLRTPQVQR